LGVRLDAAKLKIGETTEGTLTITDVATAKAHVVSIKADVSKVFELLIGEAYDFLGAGGRGGSRKAKRIDDQAVFNAPVGGSESRKFSLVNRLSTELHWTAKPSAPWLSVSASSGTVAPFSSTSVTITSQPTTKSPAIDQATVTFAEKGGGIRQDAKIVMHAIAPYKEPTAVPAGAAVPLSKAQKLVTKHLASRTSYLAKGGVPVFNKDGILIAGLPQETVYNLDGSGFTAFSTKVKLPKSRRYKGISYFEVYVDGKLRAQSGPMTYADAPRHLVVKDLKGAKTLRLVLRFPTPEVKYVGRMGRIEANWIDANFYK
jgi:hypothetical protein